MKRRFDWLTGFTFFWHGKPCDSTSATRKQGLSSEKSRKESCQPILPCRVLGGEGIPLVLQQDLAEINADSTALGSRLSYLRIKMAHPEPQVDCWLDAVAVVASLFVFTGVPMVWLSPDLGFYFDLLGLILSFSGLLLLLFLVENRLNGLGNSINSRV